MSRKNNPGLGKPYLLTAGHPCGEPIFWIGGFSHDTQKKTVHDLQLNVTLGSHPTRAGASGFSEPVSTSTLPWQTRSTTSDEQHGTIRGALLQSWSKLDPCPNCLLLLLGHILKVTGEAMPGETNVCHLTVPPGHVHTSNPGTSQEIIPLEGTGS